MPKRNSPNSTPRKRGAPPGNSNAFKHGRYTRERRATLAVIRAHISQGRVLLAQAEIFRDAIAGQR